MGKLDKAVADAEHNNLAAQAGRELKNKAKKEVKNKTKKEAKKAAKKTAKKVHKGLMKHSKVYARGSKAAARAAKVAAQAGRSLATFLMTPPLGWICSAIILCILIGMAGDGGGDSNTNVGSSGSSDSSEQSTSDANDQLLLLDNTCPTIHTVPPGNVDADDNQADWSTPGTVAYENAKDVFDHWVSKGLSGASAAGIVGWVASEGGFSMIGRAEGHYGTDLETNSVMYGVVPIPSTDKYTVGGGGIYQFTPYTDYAELNSPDWEDADKMNKFVGNQIIGGSWDVAMDLTGDNNTFQSMAQQTNPQYATLIWQSYERGDVAHISKEQKQSDAQKAYDLFNGSEHKYDATKFEKAFGSDAGGEEVAPSAPIENKCGKKSGGEWRKTGGQPTTTSGAWKPTNVPDDIKEFAIDPTSVGMAYGKPAGWESLASNGDQCTDLSSSLMYALWERDGEHPSQRVGNGIDVVKNWVKAFGGESDPSPKAGSVFSSTGSSEAGHTGVVSQVFDNGDFLIIEQNRTNMSGWAAGMKYTWNYTYVKKSELLRNRYTFFDPSTAGFTMVSGIKSLK